MKKTFFSHDKNFYAALFPLLIIISLQNLISYSVNMADNIMLGAYSQNALSGAAMGWLLLPRNIGDRNGWNQSGRLREWF